MFQFNSQKYLVKHSFLPTHCYLSIKLLYLLYFRLASTGVSINSYFLVLSNIKVKHKQFLFGKCTAAEFHREKPRNV